MGAGSGNFTNEKVQDIQILKNDEEVQTISTELWILLPTGPEISIS